ncbi:MAG: FAD synthetase family protein [Actinomycetota bacterium]
MKVYPDQTLCLPGSVVTIGAFDGVHRGHQALIGRAVDRARELDVPAVVYTFDPPPRAYFQGAPVLTPLARKIRRLRVLGPGYVVVAGFDAGYAARSAEDFLEELAALNPSEVWVGVDFRFGRGGAGDVDALATRFRTRSFEPVQCGEGEVISSSRVRRLLAQGATGEARALLGWSP